MANKKDGEKHRTAHVRARTDGHVKKGEENLTDAQRAFLAVYGKMGVVKRACEVAQVARSSHYEWMEKNPAYRRAFEEAQEDAADTLEAEVYRRAVKGVRKPIGWYKGVAGGFVREYSDLLLMFRLKALRPEKYRERVDLRGSLAHIDLTQLPDHLLARIAAGEHPFSVLAPGQGGAAVPVLEAGPVEQGERVTARDTSRDVTRNSRDVEDE